MMLITCVCILLLPEAIDEALHVLEMCLLRLERTHLVFQPLGADLLVRVIVALRINACQTCQSAKFREKETSTRSKRSKACQACHLKDRNKPTHSVANGIGGKKDYLGKYRTKTYQICQCKDRER